MTHLLERGVGDLQVTAVGAVAREPQRRRHELEDQVGVGRIADLLDERGDLGVERVVAGAVPRELHPERHRSSKRGRELGERRGRAGTEVADHLAGRERAELGRGAEVVAVGEAVEEAGGELVAGAGGVDHLADAGGVDDVHLVARDDDRAPRTARQRRDLAVVLHALRARRRTSSTS